MSIHRLKSEKPSAVGFPIVIAAPARALLVVVAMLVRAVRLVIRGMQHRREAAVLAQLDAHMLADLGLTRSDVRDATAAPLWDDPTTLLRTRALERRLRRHRVAHGFRDDPAPRRAPQA